MKNLLYVFGIVAVLFMTTSATCTKEPEVKDYTCKCTYVSAQSEPTKEETQVVKATSNGAADVECAQLQGKYTVQFYSGTCLLQ